MHFPNYREFRVTSSGSYDEETDIQELIEYLPRLRDNFRVRFPELETECFDEIINPFLCEAGKFPNVSMELAEIQSDTNARIQFHAFDDVARFWLQSFSDGKYEMLRLRAKNILSRFGTTYNCEATFSSMAYVKNKYRNRLSNQHLNELLICCTTSYEPRFEMLAKAREMMRFWVLFDKKVINYSVIIHQINGTSTLYLSCICIIGLYTLDSSLSATIYMYIVAMVLMGSRLIVKIQGLGSLNKRSEKRCPK